MSQRKISFTTGEVYHIYNRGIDKRTIFEETYDTLRFLDCLREFNNTETIGSLYEASFQKKIDKLGGLASKLELVNIIAYCLNPNHFHLILEQVAEKGIEKFMHKVGTGYSMYFNNKYKRSGSLFQGKFKAKHVDNNDYLLYLSAYVNLNDRVHQLGGLASKLIRSSWKEYVEVAESGILQPNIVLEQFKNKKDYEVFAIDSLELMLKAKEDARELQISEGEFE
jgi:putative transposase